MLLRAPKFWDEPSTISRLLSPLAYVYILIGYLRRLITSTYKSKIKIICIGNLTCGGAGKTPTAIAIAKILQKKGNKIAFLSNAYSGNLRSPLRIDKNFKDSKLVGDEAILLAKLAPVYLAKKRLDALKLAEDDELDYLIMDDGLQNNSIYHDFKILVIDGYYGFGNKLCLPAGPLREKIKNLNRFDLINIIGEDKFNISKNIDPKKLILSKYFFINTNICMNQNYVAFAGLARPVKFFNSLKENNIRPIATYEYPDHYYYKNSDIEKLITISKSLNSMLITTEKDIVKIDEIYHSHILTVKITMDLDEQFIYKIINEKD